MWMVQDDGHVFQDHRVLGVKILEYTRARMILDHSHPVMWMAQDYGYVFHGNAEVLRSSPTSSKTPAWPWKTWSSSCVIYMSAPGDCDSGSSLLYH